MEETSRIRHPRANEGPEDGVMMDAQCVRNTFHGKQVKPHGPHKAHCYRRPIMAENRRVNLSRSAEAILTGRNGSDSEAPSKRSGSRNCLGVSVPLCQFPSPSRPTAG